VAAGEPLGQVGLSGDTEFPHLHFEARHDGHLVDPFAPLPVAPGACARQTPMWNAAARRQLAYKDGAILNAGLAGAPLNGDAVEDGRHAPVTASAAAIVVYVRAINLEPGDVIDLALSGPGGQLAAKPLDPLPRHEAQYFYLIGRKRPAGGWPPGRYVGQIQVRRAGQVVIARRVEARL
jgi:murein DD-endopeptidase MepM/ murein hydrolase activator NlpD